MHYTPYHFRIKNLLTNPGHTTWLFLPDGPGLGSTYLESLGAILNLPGTTLLLDFPQDGTNNKGILNLSYWKKGLFDLLKTYSYPILVTHGFSGMFVLDTPELDSVLNGLVLMNTTTSNTFFAHVNRMQQQHHLPDLVPSAATYHLNPSNETYKEFWSTYKHYCFTTQELALGEQLLPLFAFNSAAYHYAIEHFYTDYQNRWVPKMPTLTITGEHDFIFPSTVFTQDNQFHAAHIINTIIPQAGHYPWLIQDNEVKKCFEQYLQEIPHYVRDDVDRTY